MTSLTGGPNEATEGTLNVGQTTLSASVVYGGSSATNYYDWRVVFSVTDESGNDALNGVPGTSNECLTDDEDSYTHTTLSLSLIHI